MAVLIHNIGHLYTGTAEVPNAAVLTDGAAIVYVGPESALPACPSAERIDARGRLCMPALYNAHTHAAMTMLRGHGTDLCLQDWLFNAIFPVERQMTREHFRAGAALACAEMIRTGTVGFMDMYFEMGDVAQTVYDCGMRATLARGMGTDNPEEMRERLRNAEDLFAQWDGADGRIRFCLGPHAEYTMNVQTMEMAAEAARRLRTGIHTHASETLREHEECVARHGMTPCALAARVGYMDLPRPAVLAHGVHMTDGDFALLAEKGAFLAHCPVSNLKLGAGVLPLQRALAAGTRAALGTDGCASNNTLDLFEEIKWAALLHKGVTGDPTAVPAAQAIALATQEAAAACGFPESGELRVGGNADLLLLDIDAPHATPFPGAAAHIVYGARGSDVSLTMCAGRVLYSDGQYKTLDIDAVLRDARALAPARVL